MSIVIQWAVAGLVVLGYVSIWRMNSAQRASKRLQQEVIAEHKKAVAQLKQYAADWGQLNQARAALNAKYGDTIDQIRGVFGIEDEA